MPHLCPTSWSAAFLTFWAILLLLNSLLWWAQVPQFPKMPFPHLTSPRPLWPWK